MLDLPKIRADLAARLEPLLGRQARMEAHLRRQRGELPDDWTERASELGNDEVLEQLDEAGRAEIAGIVAALARIDDGTYGTCTECLEPVPEARLEALPLATRCMDCESWEEGAHKRA